MSQMKDGGLSYPVCRGRDPGGALGAVVVAVSGCGCGDEIEIKLMECNALWLLGRSLKGPLLYCRGQWR